MEKILSIRLDEAILDELDRVARQLKMTKKQFPEEAIRLRAQQLSREAQEDICAGRGSAPRRPKLRFAAPAGHSDGGAK